MSFKTAGTAVSRALWTTGNRTPPVARSCQGNPLCSSRCVVTGTGRQDANKKKLNDGKGCGSNSCRAAPLSNEKSQQPPPRAGAKKRAQEPLGGTGATGLSERSYCSTATRVDQKTYLWHRYNDMKRLVHDMVPPGACKTLNCDTIFANNEVSLAEVDIYGFDYDYTLAVYSNALDTMIYNRARDFLIEHFKYPEDLRKYDYLPNFAHLLSRKGSASSLNCDFTVKTRAGGRREGAAGRRSSIPARQDTFITARVVPTSSTRLKSSLFSSSIDNLTSLKPLYDYPDPTNTFEAQGGNKQGQKPQLKAKVDVSVRRKQHLGHRSNSVQAASRSNTSQPEVSSQFNAKATAALTTTSFSVHNPPGKSRIPGLCREAGRGSASASRTSEESHTNASKSSDKKAQTKPARAGSSQSRSSRRR